MTETECMVEQTDYGLMHQWWSVTCTCRAEEPGVFGGQADCAGHEEPLTL